MFSNIALHQGVARRPARSSCCGCAFSGASDCEAARLQPAPHADLGSLFDGARPQFCRITGKMAAEDVDYHFGLCASIMAETVDPLFRSLALDIA